MAYSSSPVNHSDVSPSQVVYAEESSPRLEAMILPLVNEVINVTTKNQNPQQKTKDQPERLKCPNDISK